MPIYEYVCDKCGETFDELLPARDRDKERACPKCKAPSRRKVSVFGFKGGSDSSRGFVSSAGGSGCSGCSSSSCSSCRG